MVRQLHPKTGEFDVFQAFSKAGKVVDVRLISDERSGKCQVRPPPTTPPAPPQAVPVRWRPCPP